MLGQAQVKLTFEHTRHNLASSIWPMPNIDFLRRAVGAVYQSPWNRKSYQYKDCQLFLVARKLPPGFSTSGLDASLKTTLWASTDLSCISSVSATAFPASCYSAATTTATATATTSTTTTTATDAATGATTTTTAAAAATTTGFCWSSFATGTGETCVLNPWL